MPDEIVYLDDNGQPVPQWQEGEPVPHLRFDDPPGKATAIEWRDAVIAVVRKCDGLEQLTRVILHGMGNDIVNVHGVPQEVAQRAMEDWAGELYNLYREP